MLDFERQIKPYLIVDSEGLPKDEKLIGEYRKAAIEHRKEIDQVFSDKYPDFLDLNRPRELKAHKEYRAEVFTNAILPFKTAAEDMVKCIKSADDYLITYPESQTKQREEESLKKYLQKGIKKIGRFHTWFWESFSKNYILDPNGVYIVAPMEEPESDREFRNPEPIFIPSDDVIKYNKGEFAVLRLPDKHYIKVEDGSQKKEGVTLFFFDGDSYTVCKQIERKRNSEDKTNYIWSVRGLNVEYFEDEVITFNPPIHGCDDVPVFSVGNIRKKENSSGEVLYKSIISDALPHLKKALQRDSDLDLEFNFHVHTIEWFLKTVKCDYYDGEHKCDDGTLKIYDDKGNYTPKKCPKCGGKGVPSSAAGFIWVETGKTKGFDPDGEIQKTGGKPGGYVERNVEAAKMFMQQFDRNLLSAYDTIAARFRFESPLVTSGTSKAYDRQPHYQILATIAEHIQEAVLTPIIECIDAQRYYQMPEIKGQQVPTISVPRDTFDLSTTDEILDQIEKVNDPEIEFALQLKLADKKFGTSSVVKKRMVLKNDCDPYPRLDNNKKREQLLFEVSAFRNLYKDDSPELLNMIQDINFSLSLDRIIQELANEDEDFWNKTHEERKDAVLAKKSGYNVTSLRPYAELSDPNQLNPLVNVKDQNQI